MNPSLLITYTISLMLLSSCNRNPDYNACFSMDRSTANVNDIITYSNCSDYDGGYTTTLWNFGDGTTLNSNDNAPVQHTYSTPGTYTIILYIGEKENESEQRKSITIQ